MTLVERLRNRVDWELTMSEAADRIEALEASLQTIADFGIGYGEIPEFMSQLARRALEDEPKF